MSKLFSQEDQLVLENAKQLLLRSKLELTGQQALGLAATLEKLEKLKTRLKDADESYEKLQMKPVESPIKAGGLSKSKKGLRRGIKSLK